MSRRLPLAFLSALIVYGLSIVFAPPALAVNCDVNACMSKACKGKGETPLKFATRRAS